MIINNIKKNPTFTYQCDVLDYETRSYNDKKTGEPRTFSIVLLKLDGKVLKFTCQKDCDLSSHIGQTVDLNFELTSWGDDLSPSIRVVSIA